MTVHVCRYTYIYTYVSTNVAPRVTLCMRIGTKGYVIWCICVFGALTHARVARACSMMKLVHESCRPLSLSPSLSSAFSEVDFLEER